MDNTHIYLRHLTLSRRLLRNASHTSRIPAPILLQLLALVAVFGFGTLIAALAPTPAVSYFSKKSNFLNTFFAKQAWLWTSLAILAFHLASLRSAAHLARFLLRYAIATTSWLAFTQWFWGPPLMDRVFTLTGGRCLLDTSPASSLDTASSASCRRLSGSWRGGFDPSGHVFLMALAITYLFGETYRNWPASSLPNWFRRPHHTIVSFVLALWTWTLFITCVYFHSPFEKAVGLVLGIAAGLLALYIDLDRVHESSRGPD